MRKWGRPDDEFVYELVVVSSGDEALIAARLNVNLQAVVDRRRFSHQSTPGLVDPPLDEIVQAIKAVTDTVVLVAAAVCDRAINNTFVLHTKIRLDGKHVLILDDTSTTGSNAQSVVLAVRRALNAGWLIIGARLIRSAMPVTTVSVPCAAS